MYQSGKAGDEAKKRKFPAKSGRVGITVIVLPSLLHPYFELDIEQDEIRKALLIKQE